MKKNKFITKKENREIKVTVSFAIILAFLSLFIAYGISALVDNPDKISTELIENENITIIETETGQNIIANETEIEKEIFNLIKTYIFASVKQDEKILYVISDNNWANVLKERLTSSQTETSYEFVSSSLTLTKEDLTKNKGIYTVSYILNNNNESIQQNIQVTVVKEDNIWKISNIS